MAISHEEQEHADNAGTSPVADANKSIQANLAQAASEVLEWRKTGILVDGIVKNASAMITSVYGYDSLQQVELIIVREALRFTAAQFPAARSGEH
jgi:hypothetical protein